MTVKLERFKVRNFRSIEESDWIEVADNSCLVGTNEAGKTNLLIALWKLNPANKEPIVPLVDFPRQLYSNFKGGNHKNDVFISADFVLDDEIQIEFSRVLKCDKEQLKKVLVRRRYDGIYYVTFPYSKIEFVSSNRILSIIEKFKGELLVNENYIKENEELKTAILNFISSVTNELNTENVSKKEIEEIVLKLKLFIENEFGKKKNLPDFFNTNFTSKLDFFLNAFDGKEIASTEEITKKVLRIIPKFVYYSDYGNLDSEIFLPRVIEDLNRTDLSESARAKVRTLDVLFRYVQLSPQDIFELGNERKVIIKTIDNYNRELSSKEQELTDEEISKWAAKTKERGILLRSAATQLTQSFKKWWLQGNYQFDFEADGNHFRINVSDTLRPEPIELEGRSRGLQWFFSFFLVFLVETKEGHSNTVLLLDEPGLSLHPIAQYDLAKFFKKLSEDNQLIYTSHSPFLVDMDNLANVKAVYVDRETGRTKVSSNLRYNEIDAEKSIYPIHAALGLTVSDTLLLGCLPVLVEGVSDQIYLSLIKRYLIGKGKLQYSKEIVFIPTGGVKGMGPVSKLVSSREDKLPFVLLDSDKAGKDYHKQLTNGKYREEKEKVLEVAQFLEEGEYEIEDLVPPKSIIPLIDRMFRADEYFDGYYQKGTPIVNQIESWAKKNFLKLQDGWKVELSRGLQNRFDKEFKVVDENTEKIWVELFSKFLNDK